MDFVWIVRVVMDSGGKITNDGQGLFSLEKFLRHSMHIQPVVAWPAFSTPSLSFGLQSVVEIESVDVNSDSFHGGSLLVVIRHE